METNPPPFVRSISAPTAPSAPESIPDPDEAAEAREQIAPLQSPPLKLQQPRRRPLLHQASAPVTQAEMRRVRMTRTEVVKE